MNIWLILWAVLALGLIGFSVWTFMILMRQKRAWRVYAERRKLRYDAGALMDSPNISGVLKDYSVSCFGSEHTREDARLTRKLTAIEVKLNSVMPISGGVASGGMIEILNLLNLKHEYVPDYDEWDKEYVAHADNKAIMQAYLSDERVKALCDLMKIKNSWLIFVFKDDAVLLRLDLANPLANPKKLDETIKVMLGAAELLELKKGEVKRLEAAEFKEAASKFELDLDDDSLDASSSLSLEDDGGDAKAVQVNDEKEADANKPDANTEKAKGKKPSASSKESKKKS